MDVGGEIRQPEGPAEQPPAEPEKPAVPGDHEDHEGHKDGEVFHLSAGQLNPNESAVAVRWCICPTAAEKLKALGATNPHILIVVKPKRGGSEERQLLPLNKEMTYITFNSPGLNTVQATIVWGEKPAKLKSLVLSMRNAKEYINNLLDHAGNIYDGNDLKSALGYSIKNSGVVKLTFDVPDEFFAKEPPPWLKWWGNFWFKNKQVDECQFKKRLFFAFTLKPFLAVLWMVFELLLTWIPALVILSLGLRIKNPIYLLRFWEDFDLDDLYYKWYDCNRFYLKGWFWLFVPLAWVVLGGVGCIIAATNGYGILTALRWVGVALAATAFLFFGTIATMWFLSHLVFTRDWVAARKARREERYEQRRKDKDARARALLELEWADCPSCPGVVQEASIEALPLKKRTLRLRFWRLKGKVCKPYKASS